MCFLTSFLRKRILYTFPKIYGIEGYRNWLYNVYILNPYSGVYTIYAIVCICEYFWVKKAFPIYLAVKEYKTQNAFRITYLEGVWGPSKNFYVCCDLVLWYNLKQNRNKQVTAYKTFVKIHPGFLTHRARATMIRRSSRSQGRSLCPLNASRGPASEVGSVTVKVLCVCYLFTLMVFLEESQFSSLSDCLLLSCQ